MGILAKIKEFFKYEFKPTSLTNINPEVEWLEEYEGLLLQGIVVAESEKKANLLAYYAEYLSILARHEEADKVFKEAIALGSNEAKFGYALFLGFHYLYDESEVVFLELIEEGYQQFHVYNLLGNEKDLQNKCEEALAYFKKGEALGNKLSGADAVRCLAQLGRKEEAVAKFAEIRKDNEIPERSLWAAYESIITEFYIYPAYTIYEAMLYEYKEYPWTQEKENEYRKLIGQAVDMYKDALKIKKDESSISYYKGELYRKNRIDADMQQIREINNRWYNHQEEAVLTKDQIEDRILSESIDPDISFYEAYWQNFDKSKGKYRSDGKMT
ncbi:MAG: hypothetical protein ACRC6X_01420 [Culicoidibacterales bacterium]